MLYILLWLVHVIVCLFLIIVVLLQSGKAADLAGAFGGMGSQATFGPRGTATLLSKLTTIAAASFMVTSLTLSILATRGAGSAASVTDKLKPTAEKKEDKKGPQTIKVKGSDGTVTEIPLPQDLFDSLNGMLQADRFMGLWSERKRFQNANAGSL
jgi:preprotein translocase subunit SecG